MDKPPNRKKKKTSGWERKKAKIAANLRKIDSFFSTKSTTAPIQNESVVELTSGNYFKPSHSYFGVSYYYHKYCNL